MTKKKKNPILVPARTPRKGFRRCRALTKIMLRDKGVVGEMERRMLELWGCLGKTETDPFVLEKAGTIFRAGARSRAPG